MPRQILGQLMEQLVENLEEGCLGIDKEGRVQFANAAACTALGVAAAKARGEKIWDVSTVPDFTRAFVRLVKDSGADRREQVIAFPEQRAYLVQMFPVRGKDGRLSGAVAVLRDITSLSKIEADMTALVTRISQELKRPLTAVKGYVETLLEGAYADPAISRKFLQVINDETNRMARLLVGLLDAAGAGGRPPERRAVDLATVVRQAAEGLQPFARQKNVDLELRLTEPLPAVLGDDRLLAQAVTNLLDNALKFSGLVPPPGRGRVLVQLRAQQGRLALLVQDNGVGIAAEEQDRIFERFYRVTEGPAAELGGTGLGLSIARDIVAGCGGTIAVDSAPGRGSTFTVSLPPAPG